MGGQAGEGASRLQRHDHECDLRDRTRSRLGVFREARQAARHAGAVGDDTPKKIALGERAVMVDGAGYLVIRYKEEGQPVEIVHPEEGTPVAAAPSAVFKAAPNPNAARLFQNWMHSREIGRASCRERV